MVHQANLSVALLELFAGLVIELHALHNHLVFQDEVTSVRHPHQ